MAQSALPFPFITSLPPADQARLKRDFDWVLSQIPTASTSSSLGVYGDGSDGIVNFDGAATVLGIAPAAGVYTLTRDIYLAGGSQVSGTAEVRNVGYRIFCTGAFTIGASAKWTANGTNAVTGTPGTSPAGAVFGSGGVGATGGAFGPGANGGSVSVLALGGNGGAGGAGQATTGGLGGVVTPPTAVNGGPPRNLVQALTGQIATAGQYRAGAGGGAGGGQNNTGPGAGGSGGGGGGLVGIYAQQLINNGVISATGGAGSAAFNGGTNAGGGGGGGGGAVIIICGSGSTTGTITVTGGVGGAGTGTGVTGVTGNAGNTYIMVG